jgi:hypothetical protein
MQTSSVDFAKAVYSEPQTASRRVILILVTAVLGIIGTFLAPLSASAVVVFAPTFDGPSLDPGLVEAGNSGTAFSVGAGALVLTQAAGNATGSVTVTMTSPVSGDFSARITVSGSALGRADGGLLVTSADTGAYISDAFMNGNSSTVNANFFRIKYQNIIYPFSGTFLPSSAETVTLTISRIGDTIIDAMDTVAGLLTLNSETNQALGQPVDIGLFLFAGDTAADQVTFTDFSVQSVPEPTAIEILISSTLSLACLRLWTRRGR